ncbi:MAG TPA: helix-turn-helix transcriptional regulator, partial [Mycobacteriales bacterium]|nr:helix-turn-helix transcriptional regulator [Mycobacteriales bacterium]
YEQAGLHWLAAETAAASLACADLDQRPDWATADRRLLERVTARADVDLPELWWRGGDRFAPLTQREREITELAAGGWSSPRIAGHLQLSRRTIENHLQHSYRKLGVTRREELAAALGRRG